MARVLDHQVGPTIGDVAYDQVLADRIRQLLADDLGVTEKKMFGGLAFLVHGHIAIAASHQGGVLVRADPKEAVPAGAELAVMRGRPMDGWLRVAPDRLRTRAQLARWVQMGATLARSLPPKQLPSRVSR